MGVGLAAAAILGFVFWPSAGSDEGEMAFASSTPAVEASEPETEETPAAEPSAEPGAPVEPPSPEPEPVRLTLTNVPEGARITIDGVEVEGVGIELAPSEQARTVTVLLDGHEPWTREVPGDRSAELRVELRAEEQIEPPAEEWVEPAVAEERVEPAATKRRIERRRARRAKRARAERAERTRASRARPSSRREAVQKSSRRRGSRPAVIRDPGF